jgi:hypothetical protein
MSDLSMKRAVLVLSLLLLPTPMFAQARVAGPSAHSFPTRVPVRAEAHAELEASVRRVSGGTIGTIAGGVLGAAFGTYVGMAACSFNDDDQTKCTTRMPLYGLAGAMVVGGLGWVLGRLVSGS